MLLTTKELQKRLGISRDRAYGLMHSKGFPAIKLGGRYYVEESKLRDFLDRYAYKSFVM